MFHATLKFTAKQKRKLAKYIMVERQTLTQPLSVHMLNVSHKASFINPLANGANDNYD